MTKDDISNYNCFQGHGCAWSREAINKHRWCCTDKIFFDPKVIHCKTTTTIHGVNCDLLKNLPVKSLK